MKLKETFKYNRPAGIAALILVILVSIFADANFALIGDRRDVKRAYKKADMATSMQKCADELTWLCDSAALMGADTTGARQTAELLKNAAKTSYDSTDRAEAVFSAAVSIKAQLDTLSASSNPTAYGEAMNHYDELGSLLRSLASNEDYNEAVVTLRENIDRPLNRLLAPWFEEAADYEALEARFGSKFPEDEPDEPSDPSHPVDDIINSFGSLVNAILSKVSGIVTGLIGWLTRHVWLAIVIIAVVALGLFGNRKN
ncbi:MAG: hypothetical protein MJ192_08330 [Clostridia bacterium]|nr:hypothetical protein [Clostridia bacterium]